MTSRRLAAAATIGLLAVGLWPTNAGAEGMLRRAMAPLRRARAARGELAALRARHPDLERVYQRQTRGTRRATTGGLALVPAGAALALANPIAGAFVAGVGLFMSPGVLRARHLSEHQGRAELVVRALASEGARSDVGLNALRDALVTLRAGQRAQGYRTVEGAAHDGRLTAVATELARSPATSRPSRATVDGLIQYEKETRVLTTQRSVDRVRSELEGRIEAITSAVRDPARRASVATGDLEGAIWALDALRDEAFLQFGHELGRKARSSPELLTRVAIAETTGRDQIRLLRDELRKR